MRTLFVAAVAEELGDLPGEVVGIGPIVAASRMAARLGRGPLPDRVVMIGTAGAYPGVGDDLPIGSAVVSSSISWSYGVAAMGLGYVPRPPGPVRGAASVIEALSIPARSVLTTGAVTTDVELAERLSDGHVVEHLEAYGVARACDDHGVPFAAVLGISSRVGPDAHVQWLQHRDAAQDAARNAARVLHETAQVD